MHRFHFVGVICALLILGSVVTCPSDACAQATGFPRDDFSAIRYYAAPGPSNYLMVDGASVGRDLTPVFGVHLDFAYRPYVGDDLECLTGGAGCVGEGERIPETDLLGMALNAQLLASITVFERLQLTLQVPVLAFYDGERFEYREINNGETTARISSQGGAGAGIGDPRLHIKGHIFRASEDEWAFSLGAATWVSAPVGHAIAPLHFIGDRLPSVGGHLIGEFIYGPFRVAANLGGLWREEATNLRSSVGPAMTFGLAAALQVHEFVSVLTEVSGWTSFGTRPDFDDELPTEMRLAALVHLGDVIVTAGGGFGMVYGVGSPVARGMLGVQWAPPEHRDSDGDGLVDEEDGCPDDREDMDGFADDDGCPEMDNDEDQIPDANDPCPDEPEDLDDFEDEDGCPEEDNDGDGISDGYDSCPNRAEDMDGDRDTDGCPENDRDHDGIEDENDRCPDQPEDFDSLMDNDGCPEEDADEDRVPDETDACPEEPEDHDHFEDDDGCPEEGTSRRHRRRRRRR